jgi:hypothetical protein
VDQDSLVSIATGYRLDGLGIESRWGTRFFAHVQTGPGAHPASCTMGTGSFPGVKRPGCDADHPPPSSAEIKKDQGYTSTPLWAFGLVMGYLYLYLLVCSEICKSCYNMAPWTAYVGWRIENQILADRSKKEICVCVCAPP